MREETIGFLEDRNAFWQWRGHKHVAELTSGKLSDFFADCTPIFTDPRFQDEVGAALAETEVFSTTRQSWVVGSAMGAIGLAQSIAKARKAKAAFTELVKGEMVLKRFDLGEKPYVVLCEDVVTTGGTTSRTIDAIIDKHPDVEFHPRCLVIVNRNPSKYFYANRLTPCQKIDISALIEIQPDIWDSVEDLPEEMKGCVPIRPRGNWRALADEMLPE